MLLPIKLVCDRRARKDGTNPIGVQYCYALEKRTILDTQINIPIRHWNRKLSRISKELPVVFGIAEDLNEKLGLLKRKAEDIVAFAVKNNIDDSLTFLKQTFHPDFDIACLEKVAKENKFFEEKKSSKTNLDLYCQIDDYIKSREKKVCKDMPMIYRNMKQHLKAFEEFKGEPITFNCLGLDFYEEFVDYLTYDYVQQRRKELTVGLKVNTIGKTIKQFRTFLRNRIRKQIISSIDMDGWTIVEEDVDAVYLSVYEIGLIYNFNLSDHPHLINYRNDVSLIRFIIFKAARETILHTG